MSMKKKKSKSNLLLEIVSIELNQ